MTVNIGDRVTWTNADAVGHTATAYNGSFDTGNIDTGESRSVTFRAAGTFRYYCIPHPNMRGTVVVRGASGGAGNAGPLGPDTSTLPQPAGGDAGLGTRVVMLAAAAALGVLLALRASRRRWTPTTGVVVLVRHAPVIDSAWAMQRSMSSRG